MASDASESARAELARILLSYLSGGRLEARVALPAVSALLGTPAVPPSRAALRDALQREELRELAPIAGWLAAQDAADAQRAYTIRRQGQALPSDLERDLAHLPLTAPLGWKRPPDIAPLLNRALWLLRDRAFLEPWRERVPRTAELIDEHYREARAAALAATPAWSPLGRLRLLNDLTSRRDLEPVALRGALERMSRAWAFEHDAQRARAREALERLPATVTDEVDEETLLSAARELFLASGVTEQARQRLDFVLAWPSPRLIGPLIEMCREPWAQERAALVLTLRFGQSYGLDWQRWRSWLVEQTTWLDAERRALAGTDGGALLLLWLTGDAAADPELIPLLVQWCDRRAAPVSPADFVERRRHEIPAEEAIVLCGRTRRPEAPPPSAQAPVVAPRAAATALPVAAATVPRTPQTDASRAPQPPTPPRPPQAPVLRSAPVVHAPRPRPLWQTEVSRFVAENWFMVAGILMVLAGAAVLSYFTWDKHWLVRYTLAPALLAGLTALLAGAGNWLERQEARLKDTAAVLRAAAIALLPVNFMAVGLLVDDPQVTSKLLAAPALAGAYLLFFGTLLRRWCGAVHPGLRSTLPAALLCLNGLVLLTPLGRAWQLASERGLLLVVTAGFYAGFLLAGWAIARVATAAPAPGLVGDRRLPWFLGGTLALTYVEVFVLVHVALRSLPPPHVYAVLVVLGGGLVHLLERHFAASRQGTTPVVAESFLGIGLLLLGVWMGLGDPYVRVLTLILAGVVWVAQATLRTRPLHHYVGLLLAALGVAAIGWLPVFPRPWSAALGLAIALALGLISRSGAAVDRGRLKAAADALQLAALLLTVTVAVLTQWHFHSAPLATAGALLLIAVLFGSRAASDSSPRLALTAMVVVALALPYLGCADMGGRALRGNTLVFGLALTSLLWLAVASRPASPLLAATRSSVLFVYGALAVSAMALRVLFEREIPTAVLTAHAALEYSGPLLMAVALAMAAYHSRSLVPNLMAAVIVVVFFPELRAGLEQALPAITWGSGLGSSLSALAVVLVSFRLRATAALVDLGPGDRFLGDDEFPLLRFDHTLFTIPLIGSALFLMLKVDTYNVLRRLLEGVPLKTAVALLVTSVGWTLLAVYLRRWEGAQTFTHFGWMALLAGMYFGQRQLFLDHGIEWTLLVTGLLLQLCELAYRAWVVPRHPWARPLLAEPTRLVLDVGSILCAVGCALALTAGVDAARLRWLAAFAGLQLVRHAVSRVSSARGSLLAVLGLTMLLAETAPGTGPLLQRLSVEQSLLPLLAALLAVQVTHLLFEAAPTAHERLRPVLLPADAAAVTLTLGLGLFGLHEAATATSLSLDHLTLLFALVLLTARRHASGPFALLAALLGYVLAHSVAAGAVSDANARLLLMMSPWHLAAFSLALAVSAVVGRELGQRWPRLLSGPQPFSALTGLVVPCLSAPAVAIATAAVLRHASLPQVEPIDLLTPFLAAGALSIIATKWRNSVLPTVGLVFITLGNIDVIRFYFGSALAVRGVPPLEWVAAGIGVTLVLVHLVRALLVDAALRQYFGAVGLASAMTVLLLVASSYLSWPGIAGLPPWRLTLLAALGLVAGLAFRRGARHPSGWEQNLVRLSEALYHTGIAVMIWCAALGVPSLRSATTVLFAVALPAVYFWLRAEVARLSRLGLDRAYGISSVVAVLVTLWLCVDSYSATLLLAPMTQRGWAHLQVNATLALLLGALLLRLAALGGRAAIADIGGAVLVSASLVRVMAWPGMSPIESPLAAAWCSLIVGHFWLALAARLSPVRPLIESIAGIEPRDWERQRRLWSLLAAGLAQGFIAFALFDGRTPREMQQTLLLAAATLFIHAGLHWGRAVFFALASIEIFASLSVEPLSPWRVAALALATALLAELARRLDASDAAGREDARPAAGPIWLQIPATLVALYATLAHLATPALRADPTQLVTPFLAALAFGVVAISTLRVLCATVACVLATIGNTHIVRFCLGPVLDAQGLSDAHQIALGVLATLLAATFLRLALRREDVAVFTNRLTLSGAGLVLGLLTLNYFAHPDLSLMTPFRFVVSGVTALLAGLYFRRAARRPGPGEEAYAEITEGLYHYGTAMAVWCAALLLPALRQPYTALVALGVPAFYFYARAEREHQREPELSRRYRNSASVLSFILLGLYTARPLFQMLFFPETRILTEHYHLNAAVAMAVGVLLLRLHALGGTEWQATYGGLALITGGYFALTAWPGLSPFEAPAPAAWCAIGLAHFWTAVSARRSPFSLLVRQVASIEEGQWERLRRSWGLFVMLASQGLVLLAIPSRSTDSHLLAPLLVGAASVLIHHGAIRRSAAYIGVAAVQCALALHADFVVASYLPRQQVIVVLLVLWALGALARRAWPQIWPLERVGVAVTLMAILSMAHVFYHGPSSEVGLWAVAAIALLAALTPRPSERARTPEELLAGALLLLAPSWLVFFSQPWVQAQGLIGGLHTRPIVATLLALFATSAVARWCHGRTPGGVPEQPLLWHQLLDGLCAHGAAIHMTTLALVGGGAVAALAAHYDRAYEPTDLALFGVLWIGLAIAWFVEGRRTNAPLPYLCAEASLVALFALGRRQLLLTTNIWTQEYDVWVGLAAGLLMTAVKQVVGERRREARWPMVGPILVLPVLTLLWTLAHHLGTDLALVVIGLNSLIFAYHGRERRDSPYNVLAVTGFVSFVLLVFAAKLQFHVLHAYVVPAGLGVLTMLQLFGDRLPRASRNNVRLVTVLAMLGSAGYHALLDLRYPLIFNVTLLLLCLAAMGLGGLLRVRLYLALGLAGIVVDLAVLAAKTFVQLERGPRMMSVGAFVLLLGVALVGATLYHKTHSDEIEDWLARVRERFGAWE